MKKTSLLLLFVGKWLALRSAGDVVFGIHPEGWLICPANTSSIKIATISLQGQDKGKHDNKQVSIENNNNENSAQPAATRTTALKVAVVTLAGSRSEPGFSGGTLSNARFAN